MVLLVWVLCEELSNIREMSNVREIKSLLVCIEEGLWQYWFMEALMDFENIKNTISQSVSVSENESPELWAFSLLVGWGER